MSSFNDQYKQAVANIMNNSYENFNERMGHYNKALPGITIEVENEFPVLTLRKVPLKIFIAETIWYISGDNNPDFIRKYTKIWDDFLEPDGTIPAHYGYRWRKHFDRDQLKDLLEHLKKTPGSRQGVVVTWDPRDDGLGTGTYKMNVPCTYVTFSCNIMGDKLNFHNFCRSNDMYFGCPHDVAGAALLQRFLAAKIGVGVGKLTHSISHAHIHDNQYESAKELLARSHEHPLINLELTAADFDRAEHSDNDLIEEIFTKINEQYHPLPAIKHTKIVI